MSRVESADLARATTGPPTGVGAIVIGVTVMLSLISVGLLFGWLPEGLAVWGLTVYDVVGFGLLAAGVWIVGLGIGSAREWVSATPDRRTDPVTTVVVAGLVSTVVGLFCSQSLGWIALGWTAFGGAVPVPVPGGWVPVVMVTGLGVGAWTATIREDLGATVVPGGVVTLAGAVIVTDVVGPGWVWNLNEVSAVVHGGEAVPLLALTMSVVVLWAAGKGRGGFGPRGREQAAYLLLSTLVFAILGVLALIVAYIVVRGAGRAFAGFTIGLHGIRWPFVTNGATFGANTPDGVYPSIVGTVWLVIGSVVFAVPLGVGAAVFLTEFAGKGRFTDVVEIATNALWSTPSIVFGLFGYALLVPRIANRNTLLSGMLVLGFMLLPLVIITARESIKAVPDEYRDASAALGVSRWETIRSVVLPAAMPGVITGIILGVGRIAGETAPLILVMAGGLNQDSGGLLSPDLLQGAQALPYKLYAIITAGIEAGSEFGWATAFILLVVVLGFYAVGIGSRIYFRRRLNE